MANLNQFNATGNLVADPVLRETKSGLSVAQFRLAINNGQSKDGKKYDPTYIDVVTWNGRAETVAKYLSKGRYVRVTGRLDLREWEAEDGSKRSKHQVTATEVEFGPKPATNGSAPESEDTPPVAETDDIPF